MARNARPDKNPISGKSVAIRVSLHLPGGALTIEPGEVVVERDDRRTGLEFDPTSGLYQGFVEPGDYTLEASAAGLESPRRIVEVTPDGKVASAYLGNPDWPFYRLGENTVPFEPHDDLMAICFESQTPDLDQSREMARNLQENLSLEPIDLGAEGELDFSIEEGSIWVFRVPGTDDWQEVASQVRRIIDREVRIGTPVDLIPRQIKVMDNRFIVRFKDRFNKTSIRRMLNEAEFSVLRESFPQSPNIRLIQFDQGGYRHCLDVIEEWIAKDLLVYGEPDLLAEITDDLFPVAAPDDPTFANQANLTLQNADDAWQFLAGIDTNLTLGSPSVYVGTLDRGVDTDHPDIGGNLTDGAAQLAQCYDFSGLRACTVAGYAPDTNHGMGVYGIIAALTNNTTAIAGIASNTHQIGMERPSLTSGNYPDVLLWAAGFTTGNTSAGWPAEPISPAASIISCSHGSNGLALSGIMDDTLQQLAREGRGGKGTVVVYSAGNGSQVITGFRTWAAHPNTISVSNSDQPNAGGVEVLAGSSNFGPEIDLCAQGVGAPSLNAVGGEQVFGGTSAAAPTVAAACALMLSANDSLCWADVRDILRSTSVGIDLANVDPVGQWVDTDGDGNVDFSQWYGYGRLDIEGAVIGARNEPDHCYAPVFQGMNIFACIFLAFIFIILLLILFLPALFSSSVRCFLRRLRYQVTNCSTGNQDNCAHL